MLRIIFGSKTDEVARGWKILHNEEHHNLYCSSNNIRLTKDKYFNAGNYEAL